MLTLFSVPKSFNGATAIIQHNAIRSWMLLDSSCDIVLLGDDSGVAEAAVRHGLRHEPTIARNEYGTPILADLFVRMNALARYPIVGLVNTDIILLGDFRAAVDTVARSRDKFMMISSRFNLAVEMPLAFGAGWDAALRTRARAENRMYPAGGSDLFVYSRGLLGTAPPFAIGRGYWDNWLMREARRRGATLVDATAALTAVHQNHTYDHVVGLAVSARSDKDVYALQEGQRNLELAGGLSQIYTAFDATEILTADRRLLSTWRPRLIERRMKAMLRRAAKSFKSLINSRLTWFRL